MEFDFEEDIKAQDAEVEQKNEAWKQERRQQDARFQTVVCRHWVKGLCTHGDRCEFLHQMDPDRMPECLQGANCQDKDCPFKHKVVRARPNCLFYKQGFCMHGPNCKFDHVSYPASARPEVGDFSTPFDHERAERAERFVKPVDTAEQALKAVLTAFEKQKQDVKRHPLYCTTMCTYISEGKECPYGESCHMAHSESELQEPGDMTAVMAKLARTNSADGAGATASRLAPVDLEQEDRKLKQLELPHVHGGDYKYFIVRCPEVDGEPDYNNLVVSVKKGVWATMNDQVRIDMLNENFHKCDHVFLLFTVDGSNSFQGCARMSSEVEVLEGDNAGFGAGLSACFSIQWFRLCELPYQELEHLEASPGRPVPLLGDFEEVPDAAGQDLLTLMWEKELVEIDTDQIQVDPKCFEGWGNHGLATLEEGVTAVLPYEPRKEVTRLWWVNGPGFIVGCDGAMFQECFQRLLFGLPEQYKRETQFIHPGTTLLLYNVSEQMLFGIFQATTRPGTLLEPSAFAPDAQTTTLYPLQVRFSVVAEVPPMLEKEVAELLGPGNPVRRVDQAHMQAICDRMVEKGGGPSEVARLNKLADPALKRSADGLFRRSYEVGIEQDRHFQVVQRIRGPSNHNMQRLASALGTTAAVTLRGRGSGHPEANGKEADVPLELMIVATTKEAHGNAQSMIMGLLEQVRADHQQHMQAKRYRHRGPPPGGHDARPWKRARR